MARVISIKRAKFVYALYCEVAPQFAPLLIHSQMGQSTKQGVLAQLYARQSRIIICVDMLGEGFDLPALKIAALHDMHKSLAITLQFTGRFTRTASENVGDATVVANTADANVERSLQELYAEDADWNELLRILSERATGREIRRSELIEGFNEADPIISLQNIFPKMSAVIYKTTCTEWRPEDVILNIPEDCRYAGPYINRTENILIVVTRNREPVPWGDIRDLREVQWNLYLFHWDRENNLLYINSSDNSSLHEDFAMDVVGPDAALIRGEQVFRSLHGINRFIIMNLGLRSILNRAIVFSMHNGSDVGNALTEAMRENKSKSNLFGKGFENGSQITFGCSQKGRLWAYRIAYDLSDWVDWCRNLGAKLIDDSISTADIFRNVVIPRIVDVRPDAIPIAIDWDSELLSKSEERIYFESGGVQVPFFEASLSVVSSLDGNIKFSVVTENQNTDFEIHLENKTARYVRTGGANIVIVIGRKSGSLEDWFIKAPPIIYFSDGSCLIFNELFALPEGHQRIPYNPEKLLFWDWTGTDIQMESQRLEKRKASIQRRVIDTLILERDENRFDIVFDDDGAGEIADVVALRLQENRLLVQLYHCKFASSEQPGARIDELYVVCGQAQRSVKWRGALLKMLEHFKYREIYRQTHYGSSRFEQGDLSVLRSITLNLPTFDVQFEIFVVQPGLSVQIVSDAQLQLLGVTENYLRETFNVDFALIGSS